MNSIQRPENDTTIHENLSQWIVNQGGNIHKSLALCTPDTVDVSRAATSASTATRKEYSHRGIFAKHTSIKKGEELIRLPEKLALDGKDLPVQYGDKNASPWLRCLASLLQAWHVEDATKTDEKSDDKRCYLDSLPEIYDSLLNWKSWELRSFLAGTTLGTFALSGIEANETGRDEDKEDAALEDNMYKRYQTTVLPYLKYLKEQGFFAGCNDTDSSPKVKRQRIDGMEHLYQLFKQGCKCISTRAFHMQSTSLDNTGYQGPYLLPYIDLLNHAPHSSPKHVTTLQRDPNDGSFIMVAERDIEKGEEICHSYDSGAADNDSNKNDNARISFLNSSQLLQTFGFVDVKSAVEKLWMFLSKDRQRSHEHSNMTPAMLTKEDICRICKAVSLSTYPNTVRISMEETGLLDEGWECWELPVLEDGLGKPVDPDEKGTSSPRQKSLDNFSDEFIIAAEESVPDEVITICCLNFLPDEAIEDLCDGSNEEQSSLLLTDEVLDDYYLGKLVLHSIIKVVDEKLKQYQVAIQADEINLTSTPGRSAFLKLVKGMYESNNNSICWGEKEVDDLNVLSNLATSTPDQNDAIRNLMNNFMCGMTVSLEERACLLQFKKAALNKLLQLDES